MFKKFANIWDDYFGRTNTLKDLLEDLLDKLKPHQHSKFAGLDDLVHRDPEGHNNDADDNDLNDEGNADNIFVRVTPAMYGADHFFDSGTADGGTGVNQSFTENTLIDWNSYTPGPGGDAAGYYGTNELPSARDVSNAVMDQGTEDIPNSFGVNEFFQFFGQMLTHDMAEASTGNSGDFPWFPDGLPFPVGRTPYEAGTGTDAGNPREQINEETSFLDLSNVYGNNEDRLNLVRADITPGGEQSAYLLLGPDDMLPTISEVAANTGLSLLDVLKIFTADGFGGLPNPADFEPGGQFEGQEEARFGDTYLIGDNRVNQTPLLISQHLLWARNHNWWVAEIEKDHPDWTQDQIFEAARALNEADWQHVVYSEYLVKLLGENAISEYTGYNSAIDPSVINEWSTVAFRFGHDQSSQAQIPLNEDGTVATIQNFVFSLFTLSEAFLAGADGLRSGDEFDSWLRGQLSAYSQEIDGLVVDGNRNALFGIGAGGGPVFADLEVFDIERGRDHGVWNYNNLREGLGLSTYDSFDDFALANPTFFEGPDGLARLQALKDVYGDDINKLDSIIGGLLEDKYMDGQLGQTFTMLTVMQFENVRDGDQLFYENRLAGDPDLLAMIESTSLADILERNSDIDHVYHDGFAAHNRIAAVGGALEGTEQKDLAIGSDWKDVIHTYGDDDDIYAGKGKDTVYAGAGNDIVNGEEGNDKMYGEDGYDTFVFDKNSGKDKVMDFDVTEDKIDVSSYHFASVGEVQDAMHNTHAGVIIELDHDNSVQLMGVKAHDLSSSNFILDGYDSYVA
jgi:peroxidase